MSNMNEDEFVHLKVNNRSIEAVAGTTVLQAASDAGAWVPRLCSLPDAIERAVCRLCLVDIEGMSGPVSACSTIVSKNMVVTTSTPEIDLIRRTIMEFTLLEHGRCEDPECAVEALAARLGATKDRFGLEESEPPSLEGTEYIDLEIKRCVHCDRCIRACTQGVISRSGRGKDVTLHFDAGSSLEESRCTGCGDCVAVCPGGAFAKRPSV